MPCAQNVRMFHSQTAGRDSSVGLATRYGLEGPVSTTGVRRDFPHPSRPTLMFTQPPIQRVPVLLSGAKATGAWS
jgi:hypothetical protein